MRRTELEREVIYHVCDLDLHHHINVFISVKAVNDEIYVIHYGIALETVNYIKFGTEID
jgi:hypothetical protein